MTRTRNPAGQDFGRVIRRRKTPWAVTLVLLLTGCAHSPVDWVRATDAFPITEDIWYVGTRGLSAYLIKTDAGAILIDTTLRSSVGEVRRNIEAAGVTPGDVKLILTTHAHFDHVAGHAAMQRLTHARVMAGEGDVAALRSGRPPGETLYPAIPFKRVATTKALKDGDPIPLGNTSLTAIATPGHTPGCTSYRMISGGYRVVFPCSLTVAGNRLVGNRRYPKIVTDFRASFDKLAHEPADVVLTAHPETADVFGRYRGGVKGAEPELLPKIVAEARAAFERTLARQRARTK